jgi:hypothetical protein
MHLRTPLLPPIVIAGKSLKRTETSKKAQCKAYSEQNWTIYIIKTTLYLNKDMY